MVHRNLMSLYPKGYKREHSWYLKHLFNISPNGIDYHTPYNVGVEFKESFMKNRNNIWFKIPRKQCEIADLFVFCIHNEKYYILDKRDIQENFSFQTCHTRANLRINTVKLLSIYETEDIMDLKQYLDNFQK